MKLVRRWFLVMTVAALAACGAPRGGSDPVATIEPLYQPYVEQASDPGGQPLPYSPELRAMMRALDERVDAGEAEGGLGFDPVIDGQDYEIANVDVALEQPPADGRAVVRASFTNFGADVVVYYDMIETGGAWYIDDMHTPQWTLRALLADLGVTAETVAQES
jgi:hypothetical protein